MDRLLPVELARRLNVPSSALERATRRKEPCRGCPVSAWALRRGRQVLYEVPDEEKGPLQKPPLEFLKGQTQVLMRLMRGGRARHGQSRHGQSRHGQSRHEQSRHEQSRHEQSQGGQ
jgi:hypothetical protein